MPVILITIPDAKYYTKGRPTKCPHCNNTILQRWGRVTKSVKGKRDIEAIIYRYRCQSCKRTFRDYPEDIDRSKHVRGIRRLAALLWALGLSYREIINILKKNEITLSRTSVWRESQEISSGLGGKRINQLRSGYRIDKTYIHRVSNNFGIVLAVDLCEDEYIIVGTLNESNPAYVKSWLRPLVQDTNIKIRQYGTDRLDHIQRTH
jgi:transposase-like protein